MDREIRLLGCCKRFYATDGENAVIRFTSIKILDIGHFFYTIKQCFEFDIIIEIQLFLIKGHHNKIFLNGSINEIQDKNN